MSARSVLLANKQGPDLQQPGLPQCPVTGVDRFRAQSFFGYIGHNDVAASQFQAIKLCLWTERFDDAPSIQPILCRFTHGN